MADFGSGLGFYRRVFKQRVSSALTGMGLVIERTAKSTSFDALMQRRLNTCKRNKQAFRFVQIGANDGVSHDPINAFVSRNRLAGVVIEPLPDVFAKLCHTYRKQPQIKPLNLAIHAELSTVTLYRPNSSTASHMSGIASLSADRHQLTSNRTGLTDQDMEAVEVPAKSLMQLLADEQMDHLDLLQIDAEGYDFEILKSLDLDQLKPSIIRFEHGIYSGVPAQASLREALLRFYDHGYSIAMERVDALAWRHEDIAKRPPKIAS